MRILLGGGGIQQASGSIGGTTYSHNRFGAYIRQKSTPVNPNSNRQATVRALLANLTQYWGNTLTATQRAEWSTYAAEIIFPDAFGQSMTLTGLNHFVRSNVALLQAGLTQVDDGPAILSLPGADSSFACVVDETNQEITVTYDDSADWDNETGGALLVSMSAPKSAATNFIGGPFRFADAILGVTGTPTASPQTLSCPFTVQEGQKVACRARILRADGRLSGWFQTIIAVTS